MEWQILKQQFRGNDYDVVHFDVADESVETLQDDAENDKLERCEDYLGAVLWREAAAHFLNFCDRNLPKTKKLKKLRCLELGAGTGICGVALATTGCQAVVTDLPGLLPLLDLNARRCRKSLSSQLPSSSDKERICVAKALDWLAWPKLSKEKKEVEFGTFDVLLLCEVLYANRDVWPGLVEVVKDCSHKNSIILLAITLRNEKKDMLAFTRMLKKEGIVLACEPETLGLAQEDLPVMGLRFLPIGSDEPPYDASVANNTGDCLQKENNASSSNVECTVSNEAEVVRKKSKKKKHSSAEHKLNKKAKKG